MILQEPMRVEKRCPRRWPLVAAGSLLALAVLASGVGLSAPLTPAAADEGAKEAARVIVVPATPKKEGVRKDVKVVVVRPQDGDAVRVIKEIRVEADKSHPKVQVIKIKGLEGLDASQVAIGRFIRVLRAAQDPGPQKDPQKPDNPQGHKNLPVQERTIDIFRGITIKGPANAKQYDKEVLRLIEQLRKVQPDQVQLLVGANNADLQKEIQKALEQIKLQQDKVDRLRKEIEQRVRTARFTGRGDARLGVGLAKPSAALADQLDLPKGQGLVVEEVQAGSPAAKAGLKPNDVILEVAGKPVASNTAAFVQLLASIKPNTPFAVIVLRKGKKETLKAVPQAEAPRQIIKGNGVIIELPAEKLRFHKGPIVFPVEKMRILKGLNEFVQPQGGNAILTTVVRTGDGFTTRYQEGTLIITLTGTVAGGKAKVGKIYVQDGGVQSNYEAVDKVPEQYRAKVKQLVELSEKGQVRVEIRK